jgi:hypothetical protein
MNRILLINQDYITKNSEVQENVDISKMIRSVFNTQTIDIQRLLGTAFLNEIYDKIEDGTINDEGEYQNLYEIYLKPITLNLSLYRCFPFLSISITNKSVVIKNSDNSEPIGLNEIKFYQGEYKNIGNQLYEDCKLYLKSKFCDGIFPLYSSVYNQEIYEKSPDSEINSSFYFGDILL